MSAYPKWKYILVISVLILSIVYALPNFYTSYPSIEIEKNTSLTDPSELEQIINNSFNTLRYEEKKDKIIYLFKSIDDKIKAYNNIY